jgi:hypothetical protein
VQRSYRFDHVFDRTTDQATLFARSGIRPLIHSAVDGYASTVFAYGQTGSGKTYTMSGLEERVTSDYVGGGERDGLIPRSVHYLFELVREAERAANAAHAAQQGPGGMSSVSVGGPEDDSISRTTTKYAIKASYLEIYNEQVFEYVHPLSSQRVGLLVLHPIISRASEPATPYLSLRRFQACSLSARNPAFFFSHLCVVPALCLCAVC